MKTAEEIEAARNDNAEYTDCERYYADWSFGAEQSSPERGERVDGSKEWVLSGNTIDLPEGWYIVPSSYVRPEDGK